MLHWANKDQYYTKSGESFSNYAFTLENGKKVQFRLVEADIAKDNRKDNEQARVFALIEPHIKTETDENGDEIQTDILPFDIQGDLLTLRFEYKAVNKKEKQSDYITQAVEKIQNFAIPDEFQGIFKAMPTEKYKNRTLLEKYLTDYTANNKFLNQELDFYIKNEVMNLDNIQDSTDFSHIEQNLQTIKTIKTVAKEIIAFLAQLEDFQKKLWLKKKFVAGCHYLITLDHLNEAQVQAALENPKQTAQWQALFHVNTSGLNAAEICKDYPHLVVDTSLFEPKFQADVLSELHDLDEKTNGLLIHSDNFQALNLLQEKYKGKVKCIYIDPPYNSPKTEILYKNSFKHSSFLSLIENRLSLSKNLNTTDGSHIIAIDKYEENGVSRIVSDIFYDRDNTLVTVEHNRKGIQGDHFSYTNEYAIFSVPYALKNLNGLPKDKSEYEWSNFRNWGGESLRTDAANCFYSVITDGKNIVGFGNVWTDETKHPIGSNVVLDNGLIEIYPIDNNCIERKWRYERGTVEKIIDRLRVKKNKDTGIFGIEIAKVEDQFKTVWCSPKYNAGDNGTTILSNMKLGFGFPKSIFTVMDCIFAVSDKIDTILDYFAGSGTTAHAVINLNRQDNGNRKYILVEQGEYFDSVLKPRVQKVIFAKEWKDGKPQTDNGAFGGVSQIVKILKLESYEDTLNNLELRKPAQDLADMGLSETVQNDYLLHYMLDVESRDSLLNTQHFTKPFDYQLNIATTSAGAYEAKTIDLVETFNYLIGLRVSDIDDQREKRGWVTVKGKLVNGDNTLIIWRDCEKVGYGELNDFIRKNAYGVEDKAEYSEETFKAIYINGDHNVPTVFTDSDDSVKTLKVRSIEAEFLSRMFG